MSFIIKCFCIFIYYSYITSLFWFVLAHLSIPASRTPTSFHSPPYLPIHLPIYVCVYVCVYINKITHRSRSLMGECPRCHISGHGMSVVCVDAPIHPGSLCLHVLRAMWGCRKKAGGFCIQLHDYSDTLPHNSSLCDIIYVQWK